MWVAMKYAEAFARSYGNVVRALLSGWLSPFPFATAGEEERETR